MRIGIDAHSAERDGTGNCTYIQNLLRELAHLDNKNDYILYITNLDHPFYAYFKGKKNFQLKLMKPKAPYIRTPFLLAKETFVDSIDVLHVQYIAPPIHKGKLVVMIHDFGSFHFPECFSRFERLRARFLVTRSAKKATKVLTVSEFSRRDIANICKIDIGKIEVTYDGVNSYFRPVIDNQVRAKILNKYGIDGKFIFSLGRLDPRKNLLRLIDAYTILRKNYKVNLKLVIAGKNDYLSEKIKVAVANTEFRDKIVLTGCISEQDLPIFFSSAEAFVYPSLFEGFGLPCLEAMACGCPVISSNTSSIPEVIGDAGILVNPYSANEISDAIYKVISDNKLRERLRKRGVKRAKLFSWENTAARTLEIYEEADSHKETR